MSNEIRYLLHGNSDKYSNLETLLVTSQGDSVWQKIAKQMLAKKQELWRLIEPELASQIPSTKWQNIGIKEITDIGVVNLIEELGTKSIDGSELTTSEREDLLSFIGRNKQNEVMWRELALHETVDDRLVNITGHTYLENLEFPLYKELEGKVKLIKRSQTLVQTWITEWSPNIAIDIMLTQPQPHHFCKLILDALGKLENDERFKLKEELKSKAWLFNEQTKSCVRPIDILYITEKTLETYISTIISLNQAKYPVSALPSFTRTHNLFKWLTSLFDKWEPRRIIDFLLATDNSYNYCEFILDAVGALKFKLTEDLEEGLQNTKWIPTTNREAKAPKNIIYIPNDLALLQKYINTTIELSQNDYASETMLPSTILKHQNYSWLKQYFYRWNENDIIYNIISNQNNWHEYCEIILDAIYCRLNRNKVVSSKNTEILKNIKWLIDKKGNPISPGQVICYPDLQNEINQILTIAESEYIDYSLLSKNVTPRKQVLDWLKNYLFIQEYKQVLQIIGEILRGIEEYRLGDFQVDDFPLDECWGINERKGVFQNIDTEIVPIWSITEKMSKEHFKKYLLPNLLQEITESQLIKLLNWLSNKYPSPNKVVISIYNKYLANACHYSNFKSSILPKIKLLNRRDNWKDTKNICNDVVGIEDDDILNNSQSEILTNVLKQIDKHTQIDISIPIQQQDENNAALLTKYFQPWQTHIKHELIGAFLSLLTAGEEKVKKLACSYLRKRNLEEIQQQLLENTNVLIRRFKISVGASIDETKSVISIIGSPFNARLSSGQNPDNIFVGNLNKSITQLQIRYINPQDFENPELLELLKKSTEYFIRQVYGVDLKFFDKIWESLANSEQLDIEVAKYYVLDAITHFLQTLGVHKTNKEISRIFQEWHNQRHNLAIRKSQNDSTESITKRIDSIVQDLHKAIENDQDGSLLRRDVLDGVRKRIAQHGYLPQSIPFELFQNADDALVEMKRILHGKELEKDRLQFVVSWNQQEVTIMHWGRPINLFCHPDYPKHGYKKDGFDRDLEKMLCFDLSDKSEGVTGKFGLGFKSVHLICEQPQVLSGNLGFKVLAGLLPSKLDLAEVESLQQQLKQHNDAYDGTLIKLPIDSRVDINPTQIIDDFESLAGILVVFSKYIKCCKLVTNQTKELGWNPYPILCTQGIEAGDVEILEVKDNYKRWVKHKALCLQTEQAQASLLICLEENSGKIKSCLQQFSTIWVTAPTKENLELGFILNAKFNITTGREKLSRFEDNLSLAEEIGQSIGRQLCKLFQMTENNWAAVKEALGLSEADKYTFWKFIWQELAVNWLNKNDNEALKLIRQVLGGKNGMGYLVTQCAVLPSGLWGAYRQLLAARDINYTIQGMLATEECFKAVSQWKEFNKKCSSNIVLEKTWEELKKLLGSSVSYSVNNLMLSDVIKWELASGHGVQVTPQTAQMLGKLVTLDFLCKLEKSHQFEYQESANFLRQVHFLSKKSNTDFYPAQLILVAGLQSDTLQEADILEEKQLAAFAPDDRVLNLEYTNDAVIFFYACRGQKQSISIQEMANWALQAETEAKRQAVRDYLLRGMQKDSFAAELSKLFAGSWLENNSVLKDIVDIAGYLAETREKLKTGNSSETLENIKVFHEYDYEPTTEITTFCPGDDFSLYRSNEETVNFGIQLIQELDKINSSWKGYIYHFTNLENAVSIINSQSILSRNHTSQLGFQDSAGASLIARTREVVKEFARFYFRPLTPTQWHNELLGRRKNNIYALCPVPVFFKFKIADVLKKHKSKCAVSNGNLAANRSYYGNSVAFLNYFNFNEVYGRSKIASQQEFVVKEGLFFDDLDVSIICRNQQDKQALLNMIGSQSKYANKVEVDNSYYHNENAYVKVSVDGNYVNVSLQRTPDNNIDGNIYITMKEGLNCLQEIKSQSQNIFRVLINEGMLVEGKDDFIVKFSNKPLISVYFQEKGKNWLIYTNEYRNNQG